MSAHRGLWPPGRQVHSAWRYRRRAPPTAWQRPLQRHGLLQNTIANMRSEGFFGNHLHSSSEQVLKGLGEGHAVRQASVRLKLHEDVHVAVRAALPSGHGAE